SLSPTMRANAWLHARWGCRPFRLGYRSKGSNREPSALTLAFSGFLTTSTMRSTICSAPRVGQERMEPITGLPSFARPARVPDSATPPLHDGAHHVQAKATTPASVAARVRREQPLLYVRRQCLTTVAHL